MKCPTCAAWTSTLETRQRTGFVTRRRIECANGHRFTTIERLVVEKPPRPALQGAASC